MCGHKMDSQLYVNLTGLAENHVKSNIKPFLAERIDKLVSNSEENARIIFTINFSFTAVSEEGQRMLAITLSTNYYDP